MLYSLDIDSLFKHGMAALGLLGFWAIVVYVSGRAWVTGIIHANQHANNTINMAIQQGRNLEKAEQMNQNIPRGGGEAI